MKGKKEMILRKGSSIRAGRGIMSSHILHLLVFFPFSFLDELHRLLISMRILLSILFASTYKVRRVKIDGKLQK